MDTSSSLNGKNCTDVTVVQPVRKPNVCN